MLDDPCPSVLILEMLLIISIPLEGPDAVKLIASVAFQDCI